MDKDNNDKTPNNLFESFGGAASSLKFHVDESKYRKTGLDEKYLKFVTEDETLIADIERSARRAVKRESSGAPHINIVKEKQAIKPPAKEEERDEDKEPNTDQFDKDLVTELIAKLSKLDTAADHTQGLDDDRRRKVAATVSKTVNDKAKVILAKIQKLALSEAEEVQEEAARLAQSQINLQYLRGFHRAMEVLTAAYAKDRVKLLMQTLDEITMRLMRCASVQENYLSTHEKTMKQFVETINEGFSGFAKMETTINRLSLQIDDILKDSEREHVEKTTVIKTADEQLYIVDKAIKVMEAKMMDELLPYFRQYVKIYGLSLDIAKKIVNSKTTEELSPITGIIIKKMLAYEILTPEMLSDMTTKKKSDKP